MTVIKSLAVTLGENVPLLTFIINVNPDADLADRIISKLTIIKVLAVTLEENVLLLTLLLISILMLI